MIFQHNFFLYLASYAGWNESPYFPEQLFHCLTEARFRPDRFDDRGRPRRKFNGGVEDVRFWLTQKQGAGRFLYFERVTQPNTYCLTVDWIDRNIEFYRMRGDYHYLYMSITVDDTEAVVSFWKELCRRLHPFHAFLDTEAKYNMRAHEVSPDGHVNKQTGWYSRRLPGFFAHNYFGDVYRRRWGEAVCRIPPALTSFDAHGLFVEAPSGLDLGGREGSVFSHYDLEVIEALGPKWFRLPGRTDVHDSPSLAEFLAATPDSP